MDSTDITGPDEEKQDGDEDTLLLRKLLPEDTQQRKRVMTALLRGLLAESRSEG